MDRFYEKANKVRTKLHLFIDKEIPTNNHNFTFLNKKQIEDNRLIGMNFIQSNRKPQFILINKKI